MNQPSRIDPKAIKDFDQLAEFQKQLHADEEYFRLFVFLEAINKKEAEILWEWFNENSLDVDRSGVIRKKLLRWLSPEFVKNSLSAGQKSGGRTRIIPEALKNYINKHFQ